jgi:two-component system sensor histidine kinase UhpB
MKTALAVNGEPVNLPEEVHIALYRIAQESLNNVTKHSKATESQIVLNYLPDEVTLQIIDNGQGFDSKQETGGLGLGGMHERAAAARIKVQIESALGQGTRIHVRWSTSG